MAASQKKNSNVEIPEKEKDEVLSKFKARFEKNMQRHEGVEWADVEKRLLADAKKLKSLIEMEKTDGEPDVVGGPNEDGSLVIYDCVKESPRERRSLCYDNEALAARKANKPVNSAVGLAAEMGIELITPEEYKALQAIMKLDEKTSSWVKTPEHIRKLGGAVFCDRRYDTVFTYHNGADSYYSSRAFRGKLVI